MILNSQLTEVLKLISLDLEKNKTIYLEGEPGVGKTKITEHIAQCLKLPIYIFQMSANVELSDLIGGLELSYLHNQKQIILNRKKGLLEMIEKGGIFVLDESAMSQQAKEVIAWFSELAQKKPGEKIILRDIPGHPKELTIHERFHLILTSNDPKTTIGRKALPNEVSHFAEKIIYP
jgi:MoxR-like ATPase